MMFNRHLPSVRLSLFCVGFIGLVLSGAADAQAQSFGSMSFNSGGCTRSSHGTQCHNTRYATAYPIRHGRGVIDDLPRRRWDQTWRERRGEGDRATGPASGGSGFSVVNR